MYFAGPICEGIECAPLVIIVIASFLVPVILGLAVVWLAARYIIRFFDKKRGYSMSSRRQKMLTAVIVAVAAVSVLGAYLVRESEWYDNFLLNRGIAQIEEAVVYQPTSYTPATATVLVTKYDMFAEPKFEAVTEFQKGGVTFEMTETTDGKFRYDIFARSQKTCDSYKDVRYCYVNDPKYRPVQDIGQFYVYLSDKEVRIKFSETADPVAELQKMITDGWTKQRLKDLRNVSYTDSILDLPL